MNIPGSVDFEVLGFNGLKPQAAQALGVLVAALKVHAALVLVHMPASCALQGSGGNLGGP